MEDLEKFLQSKIDGFVEVLKKEMTKENVSVITLGDKLTALGGLNMAVATMQEINPDFKFDIKDYYSQQEVTKILTNQQPSCEGFGDNWILKI